MAVTWKKLAYDADCVKHSLATAANDFLVASGSGVFAKQTLAQAQTTLGLGLLKIADVSLSADASKTISSALVSGKKYKLVFTLVQNTTAGYLYGRFNNDSGANYYYNQTVAASTSIVAVAYSAQTLFLLNYGGPNLTYAGTLIIGEMFFYALGHITKGLYESFYQDSVTSLQHIAKGGILYTGAADLNRFDISTSAGTLTGTVTLYELL